jgi:acetylornithine/succinyldiaminopimelate/putrescine aminotransferase
VEDVARKGEFLLRGLRKLARRHAQIAEVRGLGLMVGVEFRGESGAVVKGLRERGILATKAGDTVLRLLPPLVVKRSEIRELLAALDALLAEGKGA